MDDTMVYHELPQGDWIRVLLVREVSVGPDHYELVCEFKHVCLDKRTVKYRYTALSYAWGDYTPVTSINLSHGPPLPLSRTLSDLFIMLRQNHKTFAIWVDALCINQSDPDERAHQVAMMGKVYSSARHVLLWLGAGTPSTHTAFAFMQSKQGLTWPEDWESIPDRDLGDLQDVFSLLSRPWFQRAWVIQEITLNRKVAIACGVDRVSFATFRDCMLATWKFLDVLPEVEDGPALRGLWSVTRTIFTRQDFLANGPLRYEKLLEMACHTQATDERDKVFAFWGIGDHTRPLPEPDYTVSVEDVYLRTAEALLLHGTSLDALALAGISPREQASGLPTWAPDLRCHSYSEPFVVCDRASWNAGGPLHVPPQMAAPNVLRLQVILLDTVEVTCPVFESTSVADQQAALRAVTSLRSKVPGEVSETEWLKVLGPSMIFGLDIDDEPVGPEYEEYFHEWVSWLQSSTSDDDLVHIRRNKYHMTIGQRTNGWAAFLTRQGTFCIGPPDVMTGDILCAVPGCRLPLIMRPRKWSPSLKDKSGDPECESDLEFTLVCWCFAQGAMYGETLVPGPPVVRVLLA